MSIMCMEYNDIIDGLQSIAITLQEFEAEDMEYYDDVIANAIDIIIS